MSPSVSIIIPTMRRPGPLACAVRSAVEQSLAGIVFDVVVVDNDPQGSARPAVERLAAASRVPVRYAHAREPGVANARNTGVQACRGEFIAFLDDDEEAPPGWLAALLQVQARFEVDAVFGPVHARVPPAAGRHKAYFERFFSRQGPDEACLLPSEVSVGCGCSLVRRAALPDQTAPFCASRNGTGGEDDLLFGGMKARGSRFAWAPDAWVWEDPEPGRLSLGYTLRRAFAYGQGPSTASFARGPAGWPMTPVWMGVGVGQALVHGATALVRAVRRSPRLAESLDRAVRGLGKIFWFPPFKLGFYGRAALERQLRRDAAAAHASPPEDHHAGHRTLDARAVG